MNGGCCAPRAVIVLVDNNVVLVDKDDKEVGIEEKLRAHQNGGHLHRAFSIFVFNSKGETLLQRRAIGKYHGGGLWTNTTCSHPRPGEGIIDAAHRRLKEEMGFDCEINEVFNFVYRADMGNGLTEHEYDHVIFGRFEGKPKPNPDEVSDWKWIKLESLAQDVDKDPAKYSPWLKIAMDKVVREHKRVYGR